MESKRTKCYLELNFKVSAMQHCNFKHSICDSDSNCEFYTFWSPLCGCTNERAAVSIHDLLVNLAF